MGEISMKQKEKRLLGLMNKYKQKQPGETYHGFEVSKEKYRLQEKIRFVKQIKKELNLTKDDVTQIIYIIMSVQDLRLLYRGCKWETLIIAISVAVKEKNSKRLITFRDYNIIKRYKLTLRIYSTVTRRLWQFEQNNKHILSTDFVKSSTNPVMMP